MNHDQMDAATVLLRVAQVVAVTDVNTVPWDCLKDFKGFNQTKTGLSHREERYVVLSSYCPCLHQSESELEEW